MQFQFITALSNFSWWVWILARSADYVLYMQKEMHLVYNIQVFMWLEWSLTWGPVWGVMSVPIWVFHFAILEGPCNTMGITTEVMLLVVILSTFLFLWCFYLQRPLSRNTTVTNHNCMLHWIKNILANIPWLYFVACWT